MDAKRVINGTYGEAWIDGEKLGEVYGLQAKIDLKKEDVPICGKLGTSKKVTGWDGKGSLKLHKVSSRMAIKMQDMLKRGIVIPWTIISKLKDPDSYGAERVAIKNVIPDDLTLADWEASKNGTIESPFTFDDYDFIDVIDVDVE
jgi:hypothetical protein